MPTIILSYRREDTAWIAGRVHDRLRSHFGEENVFMDIDSIPFGLDFREHIHDSLDKCDILLAIVGPRWATPDENGRLRLSDETDWVRIEIEAALAKKIPVIPVLIDGVTLPPPAELPEGLRNLTFRQAAPVDSGRDFHPHMDRLIKAMDKLLGQPPKPREEEKKAEPNKKPEPNKKAEPNRPSAPEPGKEVSADPKIKRDPSAKDGVVAPPNDDKNTVEEIQRAEPQVARIKLWQALMSPSGRMGQSAFWVLMIAGYLALYVTAVGVMLLWASLIGPAGDPNPAIVLTFPWPWAVFALGAKRLHDADLSGFWVLVPMAIGLVAAAYVFADTPITWFFIGGAGIIGLCVLAALGFIPGSKGPNSYGPEPISEVTRPNS